MSGDFSSRQSRALSAVTVMTLLTDTGAERIDALLQYSPAEPYAIRVTFSAPDAGTVQWIFARDLLVDGLLARVGDGDVRIMPAMDSVVIDLISPHGCARLLADRGDLADFLARTLTAVPRGEEALYWTVDAELDLLLGSGVPESFEP